MPMTAISGGAAAVNDVLQGTDSFGETKEKMHVMKTFTPEDVQTYAAMFDKLAGAGREAVLRFGSGDREERRDV